MSLKVSAAGVCVVLPPGGSPKAAEAFVAQNRQWAARQLAKLQAREAARQARALPQDEILLRGEPVKVRMAHAYSWLGPGKARLEGGELVLRQGAGRQAARMPPLEAWLREDARRRICQAIAEIQPKMPERPRRITLKDTKSRWGSCSPQGNLAFCWRLAMAPDFVLHYVVAHEMAHLAIPNHSPAFWRAVDKLCPNVNVQEAKQWLKDNGHRLFAPLPPMLAEPQASPP
jgi:predicted metal-dependent hydrolase